MQQLLFTLLLLTLISSCSGDSEQEKVSDTPTSPPGTAVPLQKGCKSCHDKSLDAAHDFDCSTCHHGLSNEGDKNSAHENMIARPSHPDTMEKICGKCHQEQVSNIAHSSHFTLQNEVRLVRSAFGAKQELGSLVDIPINNSPETVLQLADDLLRRRCLRCHPYFSGDRYPAIVRGTGCASCHLQFYNGKLVTHSFIKTPGDSQCLQCHYGNWVGYDYYGRFEHDMNDEYRTPYTTRHDYFRPFGVEFHQLMPDIHQQKGLVCVDCHGGPELMNQGGIKISCADCHDREKIIQSKAFLNISLADNKNTYNLLSVGDDKQHPIPFMEHPAHEKYGAIANCQVCHAQWSFDDQETHLLRNDLEEYDDFVRLTVQGSFEVEQILKNNLDYDSDEMAHTMTDKISGEPRGGLWYKGYGSRRWENVTIGRDTKGRLQVMRPLLQLSLSWIDEDEEVRFDSVPATSVNNGFTPYIPHTTGKAGLFYRERIENFLGSENAATK